MFQPDPNRKFHLRLSDGLEASAAGYADVGVVLSDRSEAAVLDWISVNNRLRAVRLGGSCAVSKRRDCKQALFVVSTYAPTDCAQVVDKDRFYQHLHALLRQAPSTDIVIVVGDLNAQVGRLLLSEAHLGGRFGLNTSRSDNGDRFLNIGCEHNLFLASMNFRHSKRHSVTYRPLSPTQSWSQIDHVAISYRWRGCIQDCRSYWSTCLDSDHALVCAKVSMRFSGRRKRYF